MASTSTIPRVTSCSARRLICTSSSARLSESDWLLPATGPRSPPRVPIGSFQPRISASVQPLPHRCGAAPPQRRATIVEVFTADGMGYLPWSARLVDVLRVHRLSGSNSRSGVVTARPVCGSSFDVALPRSPYVHRARDRSVPVQSPVAGDAAGEKFYASPEMSDAFVTATCHW